ncbi:MAG: nuclear transport factor 2 family protein [Clostridium sp.]|uniref:nuclear transport factor 2 family protein n=1 Tax=Clostridium sp. TaxID=1506 RepID=UPI003F3FF7AB
MDELMKGFWEKVVLKEKEGLRKYFCEDAKIRWHCTNELFNLDEYIIANCEYPGEWNGEVETIDVIDSKVITVTRIWNEEISCHAISFFILENNKIKELDEYFGDDGLAPKWRLAKKIGKKIK